MAAKDITVCVPTYNSEVWLDTAIASLNRQTYKSFSATFVDDCSTDSTVLLLKQKLKCSARFDFEVIEYTENTGGMAKAVHDTFADCSTRFYTWFAVDDELEPEYLFKLRRLLLDNQEYNYAYCHYRIINTGLLTQGNFFVAPSPSLAADNLFNIYATGNGLVMNANFAYGSGNFTTANSPSGIAGRWNYYTCVFDNGLITVYTNGVPGTPVTLGGGATTLRNTGARFFIGGSWGGPNSSRMIAYLGPIQIYGKALTQQEILQNYHSMKGRFGIYS